MQKRFKGYEQGYNVMLLLNSEKRMYKCELEITILEITTSFKQNVASQIALVKIGNSSVRLQQLKKPERLVIQTDTDNSTGKCTPLKGIIKIYDINPEGCESISSVGNLQIQEWLTSGQHAISIDREIGVFKLKMNITLLSKHQSLKVPQQSQSPSQKSFINTSSISRERFINTQRINTTQQNFRSMKSLQVIDRDRLQSQTLALPVSRLEPSQTQIESKYIENFARVLNGVEWNQSKPWAKNDQKQQFLLLKYNDPNFEDSLNTLFTFMRSEVENYKKTTRNSQHRNSFASTISRKEQKDKSEQMDEKLIEREKLVLQLQSLKKKVGEVTELNVKLTEHNKRLREKNEQMEVIFLNEDQKYQKMSRSLVEKQKENELITSQLHNKKLVIGELEEEISNLNEVIDKFRLTYGELKPKKNHFIEQEIKDCLLWIDQQNRDLELIGDDQTLPTQSDNSLSLVIRNMEIEKMPREEMNFIRSELIKILERLNSLLKK